MAEVSCFVDLDSNVIQNEASYHDTSQRDHEKVWNVMSIGEVTGAYTPLHTVPANPATWYPELNVCAASATRQGEKVTEKGNTPRCNLALTPSTPRRHGRAWTPVAPTA